MSLKPASVTNEVRLVARDAEGRKLEAIQHGVDHRGQYGRYIADTGLINAANTALALERPLLLTGEPGCGKSDFAYVAANALGYGDPLCCYIRSDTRARDLLYHYDALRRFGDAQHGAPGSASDPRRYIRLRPLGVALMTPQRRVVLIDEIDKAPRDLPNDLLHEIDAGEFEIVELDGRFDGEEHPDHTGIPLAQKMTPQGRKPLLVITSNAERQLPEPFLRRCVFYHIPPPNKARLLEIARARLNHGGPEGGRSRIAEMLKVDLEGLVGAFAALRAHGEAQRFTKLPTTSEMIEWLRVCTEFYEPVDIGPALRRIVDSIENPDRSGRLTMESGLHWSDLPGITCLVKHREDLAKISPSGAR